MTSHPSAWGDIPTILEDVVERFCKERKRALEFGVEYGYSTSAISNYFEEVTGVDTFSGDIHSGIKNSCHFDQTVLDLKEWQNISLVKSNYKDFILEDHGQFDLIHVDIIHTYEDTFNCGMWCAESSPVVVFHDTMKFKDVMRAVTDIAVKKNLEFYNYRPSNGLGILVRK